MPTTSWPVARIHPASSRGPASAALAPASCGLALTERGGKLVPGPAVQLSAAGLRHAPAVVAASGLAENGWIPVDRGTLATRFPNVFAVGDVTSVGTPKAGVFSENAAAVIAAQILARARGTAPPAPYGGTGTCYVELGNGGDARLDADFFGGPSLVAPLTGPNAATAAEKQAFSGVRRARWF
jgi:sulfide:quinone oxidoreductase